MVARNRAADRAAGPDLPVPFALEPALRADQIGTLVAPQQQVAAFGGQPQQPEEVAAQIRDQVAVARQQSDLANQGADLLPCGDDVLFRQPAQPGQRRGVAVQLGGDRRAGIVGALQRGQPAVDLRLLMLVAFQLASDQLDGDVLLERLDQALAFALVAPPLLQQRPPFRRQVGRRRQPLPERRLKAADLALVEQPVHDRIQQPRLDPLPRHPQAVRAGGLAAVAVVGAAVLVPVHQDEVGAAAVALQQPREQELGAAARTGPLAAPLPASCRGMPLPPLALLDAIPGRLVDDPQLRRLGHDPLALRPEQPAALAAVGIARPARAVPDAAADIQLVVQEAGALGHVAVDGRLTPGAAAQRRHPAPVQLGGDRPVRPAGRVPGEDRPHDLGLLRMDLQPGAVVPRHRPVAVRPTAGAVALQRPAGQATVRLLAQVVQKDVVDQAAHACLDLVVLRGRVESVRHAHQPQAGEHEAAHHLLGLDVVACQPRQVVHQQHVEVAGERRGQHPLIVRPLARRAGDAAVGVFGYDRPALARGPLVAVAPLVLDRPVGLAFR